MNILLVLTFSKKVIVTEKKQQMKLKYSFPYTIRVDFSLLFLLSIKSLIKFQNKSFYGCRQGSWSVGS